MVGIDALERKKRAQQKEREQQDRQQKQIYGVEQGLRSVHTAKQYAWHFYAFLKYIKLTEEQLIKLGTYPNNKKLEAIVIDYIQSLDKRHLRPSTIMIALAAILHFCNMNDVELNRKKINEFIPSDESAQYDRAYTHDELERLLSDADKRLKVVVLLLANGLREGAIPDIVVQDLQEISLDQGSRDKPQTVYKAMIYARSRKDRYYTFLTPETTAAIKDYLEFRSRLGETIKGTSPLIREQFDIGNRGNAAQPRKLTLSGLSKLIERALVSAGIDPNKEVLRCGGMRKFAITQMKRANVDFGDREYLVGHKHSRGLDISYDRSSEEDRLLEWSKAIDNLTINKAFRLKKQLQKIEGEQDREIAKLKAELHNTRTDLQFLINSTKRLADNIEKTDPELAGQISWHLESNFPEEDNAGKEGK